MLSTNLAIMKPPTMPTKSAMMVSSGSMTAVAIRRGVTSFCIGSVPSARMASICSVTFMEPSSLAMPVELRPATMMAVSTGPSSRTRVSDTSVPVLPTWPYWESARDICSAMTAPLKKPIMTTMGSEPTPMASICRAISSP